MRRARGKRRLRKARLEQEYREKENQLEDAYQKKIDELEPAFIDTITGVYEHIFHVELASYREVLVYLISAAMRGCRGKTQLFDPCFQGRLSLCEHRKRSSLQPFSQQRIEIIEDLTLEKMTV